MGTGNCAACPHTREEHTIEYEWRDGPRLSDDESVSDSDTEEEEPVIDTADGDSDEKSSPSEEKK